MSEDLAKDELVVDKPPAEDLRLYSVTTIIKASTSSEGLNYWGKEQVAKCAVQNRRSVEAILAEQGDEAAIKYLMDAPYRKPKDRKLTAAERGTLVHRAAEHIAIHGERPGDLHPETVPFVDQFERWCEVFQPAYEAAELTVYNEAYGYAGTCDAFMVVDGVPVIVDYKTHDKSLDSKGNPTRPYPEAALQLAAYRFAEFAAAWRVRRWENFRRRYYLLGADERQMGVEIPKVDHGLVIHITPEHCHAHPVQCDEQVFEAFLYHLEVARYALETSRGVVGEPLVPAVA